MLHHSEPATRDEYLARFAANQKVSGFGAETTQHFPCPFCAAPDWLVSRILEVETKIQQDTRCAECGRSAKALVQKDLVHGGTRIELVQISGPDAVPLFDPPIRRIDR